MEAVRRLWSRTRELVGACGWAVRSQPRLLLYPLLTSAMLLVFLTVASLPVLVWMEFSRRIGRDGTPPDLSLQLPILFVVTAFVVVTWCLILVVMYFVNAALVLSALRVLRGQEAPPVMESLRIVRANWLPLLAFAGLALAAGAAPGLLFSMPPPAMRLASGLLAVCWFAVALVALPVLVGEGRGALPSVRRALGLLRKQWGEAALGSAGLWGLLVPLSLFNLTAIGTHATWLNAKGLIAFAALNLIGTLVMGFLATLYGCALYVLAVEGTVPQNLEASQLHAVWRVGAVETSRDAVPRWRGKTAPSAGAALLALSAAVFAVAAALLPVFGQESTRMAPLLARLRPDPFAGSEDGPFQLLWRRDLPEPISAVAGFEGEIVAAGFRNVYVLDSRGEVLRRFAHAVQVPSLIDVARLGDEAVPAIVLSQLWGNLVVAYDASGNRLWTHQSEAAVDEIAVVRGRNGADMVAVGYNGSAGLCLLDQIAKERWCNDSIGNVWFVTALDCDGDGEEEVVSLSANSHPRHGFKLGCYSASTGQLDSDLEIPGMPQALNAHDLDLDGSKELLVLYLDGLDSPLTLSGRRPDGKVLASLLVRADPHDAHRASVQTANLRSAGGPDFFVQLRSGVVEGSSLSGLRWQWTLPKSLGDSLTAVDLNGDGGDELVTATGTTVAAWSWTGRSNVANR